MKIKIAIVCCALALSAATARADVAAGRPEFNWTQPATWSDGDPLTAEQRTGYQLECTGAQAVSQRIEAAPGVPPYDYPSTLPPGQYTCTLAVFARETPTATEVLGIASAPVSFTVPQPRANAPVDFSAR
jgi:hypothetical protein